MTSRSKSRLDYKLFDRYGIKKVKEGNLEMEIVQAKTEELIMVDDINHNLKLYALDDF